MAESALRLSKFKFAEDSTCRWQWVLISGGRGDTGGTGDREGGGAGREGEGGFQSENILM